MDSIASCPHSVYKLLDPRDNSVFYVGISINMYQRYKQHMQCDGTNSQKDDRIQAIQADGHLPLMLLIEQVASFEQARKSEDHWIWTYRIQGMKLLNIQVPTVKFDGLPVSTKVKTVQKCRKPKTEAVPSMPGNKKGRDFPSVIDMLIQVHETGQWPNDVSSEMRRHFKRRYPEYFAHGSDTAAARKRQERQKHAEKTRKDRKRRGRDRMLILDSDNPRPR